MIYGADSAQLTRAAEHARSRDVQYSVFTEELFHTFSDVDNRAAVAKVPTEDLNLVGMAMRCESKSADNIIKGLNFLR